MIDIEEIFSDAHPEYLEDDSDKVDIPKTDDEKITHEDTTTDTKAHDEDGRQDGTMQNYLIKISLFGMGFVFVMWLISRRRRSAYDALKQDEKSTA